MLGLTITETVLLISCLAICLALDEPFAEEDY